jgi:hypothetical protein
MLNDDWCVFGEFPNAAEAEVIKSLLETEGVTTKVGPFVPVKGVRLLIETNLVHRAIWILKNSGFTDAELDFLATGELPKKGKNDEE